MTTTEPETLFDKIVPISNPSCALRVLRTDQDGESETIRGDAESDGPEWSTWRDVEKSLSDLTDPTVREVEIAVGTAIGFPVTITGRSVEPSGPLTVLFARGPAKNGPVANLVERMAEITEAEQECERARQAWDAAASRTKSAKEAEKEAEQEYDATVARLLRIIRGDGEPGPLFNRPVVLTGDVTCPRCGEEYAAALGELCPDCADGLDKIEAAVESQAEDAGEDTWRNVDLQSLNVTPGLLASLKEAEVVTIGDWYDFIGEDGAKIDGVGPAGMAKIEAAVNAFLAERNKPTPVPPPAEVPPAPTGSAAEATSSNGKAKRKPKGKGQ